MLANVCSPKFHTSVSDVFEMDTFFPGKKKQKDHLCNQTFLAIWGK